MQNSPIFTFIGRPNAGKTSIIASITFRVGPSISAVPGQTTGVADEPYYIISNGLKICGFVDTPGFEDIDDLHKEIVKNKKNIGDYISENENKKKLRLDVSILKALQCTTYIVYVVDVSSQYNENYIYKEMEVAQSFKQPIYFIFNQTDPNKNFSSVWKDKLENNFGVNIFVDYNPVKSGYNESLKCFERLIEKEQNKEEMLNAYKNVIRSIANAASEHIVENLFDLCKVRTQVNEQSDIIGIGTRVNFVSSEKKEKTCIEDFNGEIKQLFEKGKRNLKDSLGYGVVSVKECNEKGFFEAKEKKKTNYVPFIIGGVSILIGLISEPTMGMLSFVILLFVFRGKFGESITQCKLSKDDYQQSENYCKYMLAYAATLVKKGYANCHDIKTGKFIELSMDYENKDLFEVSDKKLKDIHKNFVRGIQYGKSDMKNLIQQALGKIMKIESILSEKKK